MRRKTNNLNSWSGAEQPIVKTNLSRSSPRSKQQVKLPCLTSMALALVSVMLLASLPVVAGGDPWVSVEPNSGVAYQGEVLTATVRANPGEGAYCSWYWIGAEISGNGVWQGASDVTTWFDPNHTSPPLGGNIVSTMYVKALYPPGTYTISITVYFKNSFTGAVWSASTQYTLEVQEGLTATWNWNASLEYDGENEYTSATWDLQCYIWKEGTGPCYLQPNPNDGEEARQHVMWKFEEGIGEHVVELYTKDKKLNDIGTSVRLTQGEPTDPLTTKHPPLLEARKTKRVLVRAELSDLGCDYTLAPSWVGAKVDVTAYTPDGKVLYVEMYLMGYGLNDPLAWATHWPCTGHEICRLLDHGQIYDYMIRVAQPDWTGSQFKDLFNKIVRSGKPTLYLLDIQAVLERAIWRGQDILNPWRSGGWDPAWTIDNLIICKIQVDVESGNKLFACGAWMSVNHLELMYEPTCDVNEDGVVDIRDIAVIARFFGTNSNDPDWDPAFDVVVDGKIDMRDVAMAARKFGDVV